MHKLVQHVKNRGGRVGRALHGLYYYLPGLHRPTRPLFIVGHMRSGSTLLAHLLNSHEEIAGYGETHRSYKRRRDVWGLRAHVFVRQPTGRVQSRYVSDKIVNSLFPLDPGLLRDSEARAVVILREPNRTLASISTVLSDWTPRRVLGHYQERLAKLAAYAETVDSPRRIFFLTYHQLLHHTDEVLEQLSLFLELSAPLTQQYTFSDTTGVWGWGDTTDQIWAGTVVRTKEPLQNAPSLAMRRAGRRAFQKCLRGLQTHAAHAHVPFTGRGVAKTSRRQSSSRSRLRRRTTTS